MRSTGLPVELPLLINAQLCVLAPEGGVRFLSFSSGSLRRKGEVKGGEGGEALELAFAAARGDFGASSPGFVIIAVMAL